MKELYELDNNLCYQFKNNDKYVSQQEWSIPDDEDISYEMDVKGKEYTAIFFQWPTELGDSIVRSQTVADIISRMSSGELPDLTEKERKEEIEKVYMEKLSALCSKKVVWIRILKVENEKYYLCLYYENFYNQSNGEDL